MLQSRKATWSIACMHATAAEPPSHQAGAHDSALSCHARRSGHPLTHPSTGTGWQDDIATRNATTNTRTEVLHRRWAVATQWEISHHGTHRTAIHALWWHWYGGRTRSSLRRCRKAIRTWEGLLRSPTCTATKDLQNRALLCISNGRASAYHCRRHHDGWSDTWLTERFWMITMLNISVG